jgi:lysophospholipase L1-like esterase
MMRKVLLLILVLIGGYSYGQVYQQMSQYGVEFKRMDNDSVLRIPRGLGSLRSISGYDTAQIRYNVSDSSVYVHTGNGWIKVVRATGADADSSVFATVHKLYTTIDSLGNLIISENLGNTNLTQSDAIRTYDGDGGELSFSNLGKFKVSASDSAIIKSSNIYGTATNSFVIDSIGGMQLRKYGPDAVVTINLDENSAIINSENIDDTSTLIVTYNGISMTSSNYISLTADSILITNTPSTLTTDYDVLVRDENTGKVGIATISGGADSSYQTIEIGTAPNIVGELLNESFSGTSIPATFTNPSSASVTYNNKLIVASGSGGVSDFSKYIQATSYYNFDKEEFIIKVVPKTKTSTSYGLGITFSSNAAYFNISNTSTLNLTNGTDSGKVSFNGVSSGNLSFSVGDTIIYTLKVDGWNITVSAFNKTTNQRVQVNEVNSNRLGTGGRFRLCFMGGEQDITNVRIFSYNKKGGVAVIGDSHTSGTNSSIESNCYAMRLQNGSKYNFSNYGYPSITAINILSGGNWMNSVWANMKLQAPEYAIIALGYNDATNGDTASFRTAYRAIIDSCLANSITPILTTLVPRRSNNSPISTNYNIVVNSLATQYSLKVADVFTALSANSGGTNVINQNYLSNDNIHMSDSGHLVMSNTIKLIGGELFKSFIKDTTSNVTFNDLPTTDLPIPLVGIMNGKLYQLSNKIPTSYLLNGANNNSHSVQNASISINGDIKSTGGTMQVSNSTGIQWNFNGGNHYAAGNAGTNIDIYNSGAAGVGFPPALRTITGTGNLRIGAVVSKASTSPTLSGNDNVAMGTGSGFALSSGGGNILLGRHTTQSTGSNNINIGLATGLTTGSENLTLITRNALAGTLTNSLSNAVLLGDMSSIAHQAPVQGDILLAAYRNGANNLYLGGYTSLGATSLSAASVNAGTDVSGADFTIKAARGRGTGVAGKIFFDVSTSEASGSTLHSAFTRTLQIEKTGVAIASTATITKAASAILDIQSTTQGFLPPRMNVTQAGAILSPAEGLIIYVTNTDGTFTTKGWWGWNGAAWEKLNN